MLGITYIGCLIGTVAMGALTAFAALPAAAPTVAISLHKLELTAIQTLLRGVGGGALISLAITLATTAVRKGGGLTDIFFGCWLPITTYVACDFEHVLANFYFFAAAHFHGGILPVGPVLNNLLYSTVGNMIGALLLGGIGLPWANGPVVDGEPVRNKRNLPASA